MKNLNTEKYKRVRKDVARRLFKEGKTIYLTPSNVLADNSNMWIKPFPIRQEGEGEESFDDHINAFEYYNCNYQSGYYTNFWTVTEGDE